MRLEWPVYVFTACVFLAFALGVQFLNLGTGAVVGLFLAAHRRLCVGRLGDDQAEGRAGASRLRSLQQLWGIDPLARQALHELRRRNVSRCHSVGLGEQDTAGRHFARHVAGTFCIVRIGRIPKERQTCRSFYNFSMRI